MWRKVQIDENGLLKCPDCDYVIEFTKGVLKSEYTGGGFRNDWYEYICPKCNAEFSSEYDSKYI